MQARSSRKTMRCASFFLRYLSGLLVVTSDETAELDMASVLGAEAAEGAAAVDHPDAIEISSIVSLDEKLNAEFAKASA